LTLLSERLNDKRSFNSEKLRSAIYYFINARPIAGALSDDAHLTSDICRTSVTLSRTSGLCL